jgi:hypothetical protein
MALPIPCTALNRISIWPVGDSAHKMELAAIIIFPRKKISFLPWMSASLPRGTRKTAEERRKAMGTQLNSIAPMAKSSLMAGRATFIAAPRKGLIKEVMIIANKINLLEPIPDSAICITK